MQTTFLKKDSFTVYDGAMGTMLQLRGLEPGQSPEILNITKPEIVQQIHREYVDAGSELICANTFGANARLLKNSGYSVKEIVTAAIENAKIGADNRARVGVDMGPLGEFMEPLGTLPFQGAYDMYAEIATAAESAGADFAILETIADLAELRAGILAIKENTSLPILATMTFELSGRTYLGVRAESFAMVADGLGVTAIGVNCSVGPKALLPIVKKIREHTSLPIIVKPNAGLPNGITGEYDLSPAAFASEMELFMGLGVFVIGGCCGTNPEYISQLATVFASLTPTKPKSNEPPVACTANTLVPLNDKILIGTSLSEEKKDDFLQIIKNKDWGMLSKLVNLEVNDGANLICLPAVFDVEAETDNYVEMLLKMQQISHIPLVFIVNDPLCLEVMLRAYNGKSCIMTQDGSDIDALFEVIMKYGAIIMGYNV